VAGRLIAQMRSYMHRVWLCAAAHQRCSSALRAFTLPFAKRKQLIAQ